MEIENRALYTNILFLTSAPIYLSFKLRRPSRSLFSGRWRITSWAHRDIFGACWYLLIPVYSPRLSNNCVLKFDNAAPKYTNAGAQLPTPSGPRKGGRNRLRLSRHRPLPRCPQENTHSPPTRDVRRKRDLACSRYLARDNSFKFPIDAGRRKRHVSGRKRQT